MTKGTVKPIDMWRFRRSAYSEVSIQDCLFMWRRKVEDTHWRKQVFPVEVLYPGNDESTKIDSQEDNHHGQDRGGKVGFSLVKREAESSNEKLGHQSNQHRQEPVP